MTLLLRPGAFLALLGILRVRVRLTHTKGLVAALTNAAADLAQLLAGGEYHA